MAQMKQHRTARDLAEELVPVLETLANIRYLIAQAPEPLKLERLLLTEEQTVEILFERVAEELDGQSS
jgi:hypothetical protein